MERASLLLPAPIPSPIHPPLSDRSRIDRADAEHQTLLLNRLDAEAADRRCHNPSGLGALAYILLVEAGRGEAADDVEAAAERGMLRGDRHSERTCCFNNLLSFKNCTRRQMTVPEFILEGPFSAVTLVTIG